MCARHSSEVETNTNASACGNTHAQLDIGVHLRDLPCYPRSLFDWYAQALHDNSIVLQTTNEKKAAGLVQTNGRVPEAPAESCEGWTIGSTILQLAYGNLMKIAAFDDDSGRSPAKITAANQAQTGIMCGLVAYSTDTDHGSCSSPVLGLAQRSSPRGRNLQQ